MKSIDTAENASGQRADRRALAEINELIDHGVYDAASVLAWDVQRETPGDPTVWLLLARIDYLRERYAAAMYAARMATRLDPSSAAAWFALASTAVTRSRWRAEGLDAALQATALAPGRAKNWTVLAQLQLAGGAQYEAAVSAERAVRVDPAYRGGHLMLGEIALEAGEWRHAEAAFRAALELDALDRDARDGLAEALEAQERDPDEELAQYGPAPTSPEPDAPRATIGRSLLARRGRPAPRRWGPPLPVVVVGALAAGLLLGAVVPGLGVVRGLVGAVAVSLMWVALRPARQAAPAPSGRGSAAVEEPPPAPAATAGGSGAVEEPPAPAAEASAQSDETAPSGGGPGEPVDGRAGVEDEGAEDATLSATPLTPQAAQDDPRAINDRVPRTDGPLPPTATPGAASTGDATAPDDIGFDIPDDPAALAALSRARLAASDLELAHAAASRLEAVAPGSIEAHRALGAVALAEHDYEQARLHYGRVLELEPLDQEAHERLALAAEGLQRGTFRLPLRRFRGRR